MTAMKVTALFRMQTHPNQVAIRKVLGGSELRLLPLHITIPLPLLNAFPLLLTLPDLAGLSRRHRGETWIYPRGRFRNPPSSGCTRI